MLRDVVDAAIDHCLADRPDLDRTCLWELLQGRADYLGAAEPRRWRTGDVKAVLLDLAVTRLTGISDLAALAVPTLTAYLDHLEATATFHPGSSKPAALRRDLAQAGAEFPAAFGDRSRWRMAKTFFVTMRAEGVDIADDAATSAWLEAFSDRIPADRVAVLGHLAQENPALLTAHFASRDGRVLAVDPAVPSTPLQLATWRAASAHAADPTLEEPETFAPVPLPGGAEAAQAARCSALLAELLQVSRWVVGRKTTSHGGLVPADVEALSHLTGDAEPGSRWRDLRDTPRARRLLSTAQLVELLVPGTPRWVAGPRLPDGSLDDVDDDSALDLWEAVFTVVERKLVPPPAGGVDPTQEQLAHRVHDIVAEAVPNAVITLYEWAGGEGTPVDASSLAGGVVAEVLPPDILDAIDDAEADDDEDDADEDDADDGFRPGAVAEALATSMAGSVCEQLWQLHEHGALTLTGVERLAPGGELPAHLMHLLRGLRLAASPGVEPALTPLGLWAVSTALQRQGCRVS